MGEPCYYAPMTRSLTSWLHRCMRRSTTGYLLEPRPRKVWTANDEYVLEKRIRARVARERAKGTYEYCDPELPPAVRPNGGLRGSTATRWH